MAQTANAKLRIAHVIDSIPMMQCTVIAQYQSHTKDPYQNIFLVYFCIYLYAFRMLFQVWYALHTKAIPAQCKRKASVMSKMRWFKAFCQYRSHSCCMVLTTDLWVPWQWHLRVKLTILNSILIHVSLRHFINNQ